jgi:hypothetical protein
VGACQVAVANKIQFLAIAIPRAAYLSQCKGSTTQALRHFSDSTAVLFAVQLQLVQAAGASKADEVQKTRERRC